MSAANFAADARGAIWLSGDGTRAFLHRMTTAAVEALEVDAVRATLVLTDT